MIDKKLRCVIGKKFAKEGKFNYTYFAISVSLRGTVIIIANHGDRIDIPAGAVLENKIVSGNLRILDH